jgi:hypothetical protein
MKLLQKPLEAYKAQAHKNSFCDRFTIFIGTVNNFVVCQGKAL